MKSLLQTYTNYNYWANQKMIAQLEQHENLLHKTTQNSFPTIYKTLEHIRGAEMIWYSRLIGDSPTIFPSFVENGNIENVRTALLTSSQNFIDLITVNSKRFFENDCAFSDTSGKLYVMQTGLLIQHCMNHSTYHRGQITAMLRGFGVTSLQSTDLIYYLRDKGVEILDNF